MPESQSKKTDVTLDPNISALLVQHLKVIEKQILNRAKMLAKEESLQEVMPRHVFTSINEYAPGTKFVEEAPPVTTQVIDALSSTIGVSAILAIIFGLFGLFGFTADTGASADQAEAIKAMAQQKQAFIDIAKIFAGAVVGAAGAKVIGNKK